MAQQPAKKFELSAELLGHEKPVRTVCALKNGQIVSGAMDCFVLVWGREGTDAEGDSKMEAGEDGVVVEGAGAGLLEDGGGAADEHVKRTRDFACVKKLTHHSDYVYALCDGEAGRNYFFTGGKDKKVFKIEYGTFNTVGVFNGHEGAVNSLAESGGMLYSGSWDATFRVWDSSAYTLLIKKDAGVHAVTLCVTPDARLFTGSQDGCLKLWMGDLTVSGGNLTVAKEVNKAHTDIIRRIVFSASTNYLFTTSNDQSIKIWLAADLTELSVLAGHSAFVFDLALGSGDALFSGGEERSLFVWDLSTMQKAEDILHGNTVWGLTALTNGDVATACADGTVRVWTQSEDRFADLPVREAQMSAAVEAASDASKQGGSVSLEGLPSEDQVQQFRGKKQGEIKMFRTVNNTVNAYTWNGGSWDLIGEVTGQAGQGGGGGGPKSYAGDQFFEAGEYDFVFDVELGEGGKTAQLPYNRGDNQLVVAEKFCARESIHKGMVQQITDYLRQQSGDTGPPTSGGASTRGAANGSTMANGNGSAPAAPAPNAVPKKKHFPVDTLLFHSESSKPEAALAKILELNEDFKDEMREEIRPNEKVQVHDKKFLTSEDVLHLKNALTVVIRNKRASFRPVERDIVWGRLLQLWPGDDKYMVPVVDVCRQWLLHPEASDLMKGSDRGWPYLSLFLQFLKKSATKPLGFLAARALANAFSQPTNQFALLQYRQQVLPSIAQTIATHGEALHKNCKVALATMLLNYAVSVRERQDSAGDVAGVVLELLPAVKAEPEAVYRALAALGTAVHGDKEAVWPAVAGKLEACFQKLGTGLEARSTEAVAELKRWAAS